MDISSYQQQLYAPADASSSNFRSFKVRIKASCISSHHSSSKGASNLKNSRLRRTQGKNKSIKTLTKNQSISQIAKGRMQKNYQSYDFGNQINNNRRLAISQSLTEFSSLETKKRRTVSYHQMHLEETFDQLRYSISVKPPTQQELNQRAIYLQDTPLSQKTLILDLDETLVNSTNAFNPDLKICIRDKQGLIFRTGVNIRPFVKKFLIQMRPMFEIIVFTASEKNYADSVLNYLDPKKELIDHRLYRESCIQKCGLYIKDLRILKNRKLSKIVLVDNLPHSYLFQINNGIPITSWYGEKEDKELLKLAKYLKCVASVDDVRVINRKSFQLHKVFEK